MLYGPSTSFSYPPPKKRPKRYGSPALLVCKACGAFIVMMTAPKTGRRVAVLLSRVAASPSLVYSYRKFGFPHHHDPTDTSETTRSGT